MICPLCESAFNQICKNCEYGFLNEQKELRAREPARYLDEEDHWHSSGTYAVPVRYDD